MDLTTADPFSSSAAPCATNDTSDDFSPLSTPRPTCEGFSDNVTEGLAPRGFVYPMPPRSLYYYHVAYLSTAIVLGVPGNFIVVLAYACLKKKSSCDLYILYIAILDLIICLFRVPTHLAMETGHWLKTGSDALCKCVYWLSQSVITASVLLFAFIAIDRYVKVCHPSTSISARFSRNCILVISLCSCLAATPNFWLYENGRGKCMVVPSLLGFGLVKYYYTALFLTFVLMLLIVVVCYTSIIIKVKRSHLILKAHQQREQSSMTQHQADRGRWAVARARRVGTADTHADTSVSEQGFKSSGRQPISSIEEPRSQSSAKEKDRESLSALAHRLRNPLRKSAGENGFGNSPPPNVKLIKVRPLDDEENRPLHRNQYALDAGTDPNQEKNVQDQKYLPSVSDQRVDSMESLLSNQENLPTLTAADNPGADFDTESTTRNSPDKSNKEANEEDKDLNETNGLNIIETQHESEMDPAPDKSENLKVIDSDQTNKISENGKRNDLQDDRQNICIMNDLNKNVLVSQGEKTQRSAQHDQLCASNLPTNQQFNSPALLKTHSMEENDSIPDTSHSDHLDARQLDQKVSENYHLPMDSLDKSLNSSRHGSKRGNANAKNVGIANPSTTAVFTIAKSPGRDEKAGGGSTDSRTPSTTNDNTAASGVGGGGGGGGSSSGGGSVRLRTSSRSFRLTLLLLMVTAVFVVSWIPPYVAMVWYFYVGYTPPLTAADLALQMYAPTGYVLNHFVNPILYLLFSSAFRAMVVGLWKSAVGRCVQ